MILISEALTQIDPTIWEKFSLNDTELNWTIISKNFSSCTWILSPDSVCSVAYKEVRKQRQQKERGKKTEWKPVAL